MLLVERFRTKTAIGRVGRFLAASQIDYQKGWHNFKAAKQSYEEAGRGRDRMLERILKQQELAICSDYHFIEKDNKDPSLDQLGVFPKNQMRLLFNKSYQREQRGDEHAPNYTVGGEISILSLCPEHFPKDPNSKDEDHVAPHFGDIPEGLKSEIVMRDGKLILVVNGMIIDIEKLGETEEVKKIQLSGQSPSDLVPGSPIYGHFGIPDLPPKPIRLGM